MTKPRSTDMSYRIYHTLPFVFACHILAAAVNPTAVMGQSTAEPSSISDDRAANSTPLRPDESAGVIRLAKDFEIWLDTKHKQVIVGGQICLRKGVLEMLACPKGTKEHESIVSVNCKAYLVHAAILALGVQPGKAAKFDPEYVPAKGRKIEVEVLWKDEQGHAHKVRAQHWIKHLDQSKTLEHPWVFVGSGFWIDQETGQRYYYAEAGELICVSNFSTATLDLPVPSSPSQDALLFEANTDKIPPLGTKVWLLLRPR